MLEELKLPIAVPLPPTKEGEVFDATQWATLTSMIEVFIPPITSATPDSAKFKECLQIVKPYLDESATPELFAAYLAESVVNDKLKEALRRRLIQFIPASQIIQLSMFLSALNSRVGLLILTGGFKSMQSMSIQDRTKVLCNWSRSFLFPLRAVFSSIEALAKLSWLPATPTLHKLTGFPVIPEHSERNTSFEFAFSDFGASAEKTVRLQYDIVIVGSGCGAGVVASHLARNTAHLDPKPRIAVLEKSYSFPSSHFPMTADAAGEHLMETGGGLQSDDGSIAIIAGSTWGGGGTVNWSASLQPQHFVREEWQKEGLDMFGTSEFQDCLDVVCDRMGVAKMTDDEAKGKIPHNYGNTMLLEGARKLGMTCEVVPQNSKGEGHWCGYCSEGCAGATKQGPANCWLPDAASHGVDFIEGCYVHEILWENVTKPLVARGIRATWTSRDRSVTKELLISSPRVVVSGGTLNSPTVLIRSGITSYHVGRNLHLHPTLAIGTVWRERAKPWDGPILTAAVTSYENVDGHGHGPKIEMLAGTPSYMLPWTPWNSALSLSASSKSDPDALLASALDYKLQCAKYGHTAAYIALQRDRDTGRVYIEPKDPENRQLRIDYTASKRDKAGLIEGVLATARIAYVQGAMEIRPYAADIPPFVRSASATPAQNDELFKTWLADARRVGINNPGPARLGSAHQMGTCRMSRTKDEGVVDQSGKVWGTKGVYVADASVFPSASGVNPMVTTMGIAEWIARGIVREVKKEWKAE